jgi:hypothetical protein
MGLVVGRFLYHPNKLDYFPYTFFSAMIFSSSEVLLCSAFVVVALIVFCGVKLIGPILSPTVIPYPWPEPSGHKQDKKLTVVLAGSFNPPHNGHLAMLLYLAERYVVMHTACCMLYTYFVVQPLTLFLSDTDK